MRFYCLDERQVWHQAAISAAKRAGHSGKRIFKGEEAGDGIGFIRPHAEPRALKRNHHDFEVMAERCQMIQDHDQVLLYEDKSGQFARWGDWMPETWRFTCLTDAVDFVREADYPLVSKADVGASSVNVRILKDREQAHTHVTALFGPGVEVRHCAGGAKSQQKGYALLQRFIPHSTTWRVNAIGRGRAIFKRFCYPDRPVAQTGNVKPVMALDAETESLLEFADRFFQHARTKWCALDVLRDGDSWKILETSLAWPWPSPGTCNEAPIFRTTRRWSAMFDAMFDELACGVWSTG
jgi:glutathione synthase/RimK-type ligase-like ATP-grasp enzyme